MTRPWSGPWPRRARAGIPTVIIDSALASEDIVSFVATDNRKGGELAAGNWGSYSKAKGKAILLRYQEGANREEGFLEVMKSEFPGIQMISSNQYAGVTRDSAKRASENLLSRFGRTVDGIFCPNEHTTFGMLLALQDFKKAGKIAFVGFDFIETFVEAMGPGRLARGGRTGPAEDGLSGRENHRCASARRAGGAQDRYRCGLGYA